MGSSLVASMVSPPVAKNAAQKKLKPQTSIIPGTRSRRVRRVSVKRESVTHDNNTVTAIVVATDGGKDNARKNSCSRRTKKMQTKRNKGLIPSSKFDDSHIEKTSHLRKSIGGERRRSSYSVPSSSFCRNSARDNEEKKTYHRTTETKKKSSTKITTNKCWFGHRRLIVVSTGTANKKKSCCEQGGMIILSRNVTIHTCTRTCTKTNTHNCCNSNAHHTFV